MWDTVADELESAKILGKKAFFLASDRQALESSAPLKRDLVLIDAHDPFLDQRDRQILSRKNPFTAVSGGLWPIPAPYFTGERSSGYGMPKNRKTVWIL